ncbi:hypothetical protein M2272_002192 [Mycobacterium frederiksbergense]|uniref:Uncharacterized protein n=1 Tax=Mycolicibacterium frederiksbergense TaxID=117567 RepID=A0ABT6KXV9_9MYCO|nr:hypothetical protein [Mycolicibacterium frederiksbergense]
MVDSRCLASHGDRSKRRSPNTESLKNVRAPKTVKFTIGKQAPRAGKAPGRRGSSLRDLGRTMKLLEVRVMSQSHSSMATSRPPVALASKAIYPMRSVEPAVTHRWGKGYSAPKYPHRCAVESPQCHWHSLPQAATRAWMQDARRANRPLDQRWRTADRQRQRVGDGGPEVQRPNSALSASCRHPMSAVRVVQQPLPIRQGSTR